jgi:hypothetical protein
MEENEEGSLREEKFGENDLKEEEEKSDEVSLKKEKERVSLINSFKANVRNDSKKKEESLESRSRKYIFLNYFREQISFVRYK